MRTGIRGQVGRQSASYLIRGLGKATVEAGLFLRASTRGGDLGELPKGRQGPRPIVLTRLSQLEEIFFVSS